MKKEDEKKAPAEGDEGAPPVAETILERSSDPDQAVIAEQAIRSYAAERLSDWYGEMESAVNALESWIQSQGDDAKQVFADRGFFDSIGDGYVAQLMELGGGKGSPISDAIANETDNTISWAQHAESDLGQFINYMRRGLRDACWFVRDALPSLLSNQWPHLLDLAYGGSTDFIPALHALGMPSINFKASHFADKLIHHASSYRKAIEPMKDQVARDATQSADKKADVDKEAQQVAQDDELKKKQATLTEQATAVM